MFKQYRRKQIAELRPYIEGEVLEAKSVEAFKRSAQKQELINISVNTNDVNTILVVTKISVSQADRDAGSPKVGDMIARNPKNHEDQWLVAKQYFEDNFESV